MRISSQLLLNFLLNAAWQIALIAALASLGAWLLRSSSARYRHWLWVSALCLAFLVPVVTSLRIYFETAPTPNEPVIIGADMVLPRLLEQGTSVNPNASPFEFQLSTELALILIGVYGIFVVYRGFKLVQAWQTTRTIKRDALELEADENVVAIINKCENDLATDSRGVKVLRSETLPVPVTMGLGQPVIILPAALLREGNTELLTSAIGHEFIHVTRNDYALNFIYELLYLPISFHPAAALLRRRIKQTRELCCDELVATRILKAEVYARSLLRLAGSAPTLRARARRLSVTTTVGIADADILEARIMSLLTKPKVTTRWKKTLLFAVSVLLLVPCVAAAAFNMRFDVAAAPQERSQDVQERKQRRTEQELLREKIELPRRPGPAADVLDPAVAAELERKREFEVEMRAFMHTTLVRLAKITMEQAIQIATIQQPGKVLSASLGAKGWEEPGKLSKDGQVFYHVHIADDSESGVTTHVWVNAIDGTILGTDKELPRKQRSPENQ
ncbi:MAG TPA: M56 family metallopeptidase [Pyrinomonadaceae bacterium]|nr:M56 family metallopeptidase [Pyrinomonadaceae bacterium]